MVESQPSKLLVAGSSPVSRSLLTKAEVTACVAQLVEHVLGKDEVTGSIPVASSTHKETIFLDREISRARHYHFGMYGLQTQELLDDQE